jgi:hypothetical protein
MTKRLNKKKTMPCQRQEIERQLIDEAEREREYFKSEWEDCHEFMEMLMWNDIDRMLQEEAV